MSIGLVVLEKFFTRTPQSDAIMSADIIKLSIRNSFQVTTYLLNSENLKVAIAQLCDEL